MSKNEKNEKFRKLAEKRVNNAIKQLDLIGNLSNRYSYDYSDEEINFIMEALDNKLKEVKERFAKNADGTIKFSLSSKEE